jgi:hypothetical protein
MVTSSTLHHLIVFSSPVSSPFSGSFANKVYESWVNAEEYGQAHVEDGGVQLFAVSPDGSQAGLLGGIDWSFFSLYPSKLYSTLIKIQYSNQFDTRIFPFSKLPAECFSALDNVPTPCFEFQFSPNGDYLGYRYGTDRYRPDLRILETRTGKTIFASEFGGNHWYLYTPDNRVLMAFGHDEGGSISLFDPKNLKLTSLGTERVQHTVHWNKQSSAFVVNASDYHGLNSEIWGYNLLTNRIFLRDYGVINLYTWTPDGSSVLYEKSDVLNPNAIETGITTYNVMHLMLAPISGKPYQILGHYHYDFHLCKPYQEPCDWLGDWIPIRRIRANPRDVGGDSQDNCLSYGIDCPNPTEYFLFNWLTGNIASPDYAVPPTPTLKPSKTPTATPTPTSTPIPGPDLSRQPVYAHPSGAYAFYVGLNGASLWLVPQEGDAVLWVAEGENFIYFP